MNKLREKLAHREHELERQRNAVFRNRRAIRFLRALIRKREQQHPFIRVMYDSVTLSAIPIKALAVAGYTSGSWPTYPELAKLFPRARRLSIAVSASHDAECLDVEPGDASPSDVATWVARQRSRGVVRPVIYTSVSGVPAVLDALAKRGIRRDDIRLWTAHYSFYPHICGPSSCGALKSTTADATQWTDNALGRNLDESRCGPRFFT